VKNYAGANNNSEVDAALAAELEAAGIEVGHFNDNTQGEVKTKISGWLAPWRFERAWYYWVCIGPAIPIHIAEELHRTHGTVVRTDGFSGGEFPSERGGAFGVSCYHVDTLEGLIALADVIRKLNALDERTIDYMIQEIQSKKDVYDHNSHRVLSILSYDSKGNVLYVTDKEETSVHMTLSMFRSWSFIGTKNFF